MEEPKRKRGYVYGNVVALMRAIFRKKDAVEVAVDLLKNGSDGTRAKIFSQCLEYLYGKPVQPVTARAAENDSAPFDFICHIPQPKYPEPATDATGLPRQAAAGGTLHTTQEDEHE